jgi:hypothetical protein
VKRMLCIAATSGVRPETVSMCRAEVPGLPEPDVVIGDMADWNRDRPEEMRVWASRTPGRGRTPSISRARSLTAADDSAR